MQAPENQATADDGILRALERYKEPIPSEPLGLANRGERMHESIRQIEALVDGFKERVNDLSEEFEAMRAEIDDQLLRFDGLEQDYVMAMECVKEEQGTVERYAGLLANAERGMALLSNVVPEEHRGIELAFSQARPW